LEADPGVRIYEDVVGPVTGWSQISISVNPTVQDLTGQNRGADYASILIRLLGR
jgi:hypothetical protein